MSKLARFGMWAGVRRLPRALAGVMWACVGPLGSAGVAGNGLWPLVSVPVHGGQWGQLGGFSWCSGTHALPRAPGPYPTQFCMLNPKIVVWSSGSQPLVRIAHFRVFGDCPTTWEWGNHYNLNGRKRRACMKRLAQQKQNSKPLIQAC